VNGTGASVDHKRKAIHSHRMLHDPLLKKQKGAYKCAVQRCIASPKSALAGLVDHMLSWKDLIFRANT
jgi:hypothetical protein